MEEVLEQQKFYHSITGFYDFEGCHCNISIFMSETICYQETCLNRLLEQDLLILQKVHASMNRNYALAKQIQSKLERLLEVDKDMKDGLRHRASKYGITSLAKHERRLIEDKISFCRAARIMREKREKRKVKMSRRKQLTKDVTQAEKDYEIAKFKKMEDEEKRKEIHTNSTKPSKKGPKTHFRKSKKPGRA